MLYRFHAILDWGKAHQGKVVLGGTALYGLLRLIDTISTWLGRREAASTLFNDIWDTAVVLGVWTIFPVVGLIVLYAQWPVIKRRISGPAFEVRTIYGDTLATPPERSVIAKLAVKNVSSRPLKGVSIRVLRTCMIHETGYLWGQFSGEYPSIHPDRGETFLLRWAAGEASADRRFLDIPNDGAERIADCLVLDRTDPRGVAYFAAANPDDLKDRLKCVGYRNSWWKIDVLVAAKCGTSDTVELVACVCDRDPGPISFYLWHPRGEQILENTRQEFQAEQNRRLQAQKLAEAGKEAPPTEKEGGAQ